MYLCVKLFWVLRGFNTHAYLFFTFLLGYLDDKYKKPVFWGIFHGRRIEKKSVFNNHTVR